MDAAGGRLRVLVVDDEAPAREELGFLLSRDELVGEVLVAAGAQEALRHLGAGDVDVVLSDVHMPGLDGLDLARAVSRLASPPAVVFVTAHEEHARELAESSPSIVTPLNRFIGYENAAAVAKTALKEGKTIRQVVVEKGFVADDGREGTLTEEQLDAALDVLSMTRRP